MPAAVITVTTTPILMSTANPSTAVAVSDPFLPLTDVGNQLNLESHHIAVADDQGLGLSSIAFSPRPMI